jgi:hypothetical protein
MVGPRARPLHKLCRYLDGPARMPPSLHVQIVRASAILRDVLWQELQCRVTMKASVFSFVDDTHPATTELLDDAVCEIVWSIMGRNWSNLRTPRTGESTRGKGAETCRIDGALVSTRGADSSNPCKRKQDLRWLSSGPAPPVASLSSQFSSVLHDSRQLRLPSSD